MRIVNISAGAMRNASGEDEVDVVQTAMKIIPKDCGAYAPCLGC
jgi:hypothetical protein